MLKQFAAGVVVAVMLSGAAMAGPWEDGLAAYQRGDYATTLKLWRPFADRGDSLAQLILGVMYDKGQGVPQDYAEAVRWYRLAADQGEAAAQTNLGIMYRTGQGVPQDYMLEHMWFNLAAAHGNSFAVKNRALLATRMTPDQIAEAQRMARDWKPKPAE